MAHRLPPGIWRRRWNSYGFGVAPRYRPFVGVFGALVALALALGGAVALQGDDAEGPSPAQGHAEVIAHGVAVMPADQIAWRVVADTAAPADEAETAERALGFALAADDAIVVNDFSFGTRTRLAGGEAVFVPNGASQQRASLGDDGVGYYRIGLVAAEEAQDAGGGQLGIAGEAFAAPDGERDLDLVRDVLAPDESTELADTGFPTLVLVTAGEAEVEAGGGLPTPLGVGEGAILTGDLTVTATGTEDATFVAALIGPEVPPLPAGPAPATPAATPVTGTGSITLAVLVCPADVDVDNISTTTCPDFAPAPLDFTLTTPDGGTLTMADITAGDGGFGWTDLPFGTYLLSQTLDPAVYSTYLIPGFELDTTTGAYIVTISADTPDVGLTVFNLPPLIGVDTDGDAVSDEVEEEIGTDPNDPDSDDDGLTDGTEIATGAGGGTGTDPLVFDTDGDGFGDGDEVAAGTDPLDPASFPVVASPTT